MRHLFLLLGLVPGLGQAHSGAPLKGAFLLTGFLVAINAYCMMPFWFPERSYVRAVRIGCLVIAGTFWGYSFLEHYRRIYRGGPVESSGSDASTSET